MWHPVRAVVEQAQQLSGEGLFGAVGRYKVDRLHQPAVGQGQRFGDHSFRGDQGVGPPVDQADGSPIRAEFYKKATGREPAQVKAAWSRLVFSGKAQPPKEVVDSGAVKKAVAGDSKAVGYIEKSAVDGTVKVLSTVE